MHRPTPTTPTRPAWLPHLGALLLAAALALLATWPLVANLGSGLPADPTERAQDVWQHIWNLWWVSHALLERQVNPVYYTDALFYPHGAWLGLHTLNLPFALLGTPLVPLLGVVPTYNLLLVLTLTLTGYSTFLLARHVSGSLPAAYVASVIVQCSPMRLDQVRLSLLATWNDFGLILALLALLLALQRRTWGAVGVAGLALLLAGLNNWYHLFHMSLLATLLLAWRLAVRWRTERADLRPELRTWLRVGGVTALLVAPFLLPGALLALDLPDARKAAALVSSAELTRLLPLPATFGFVWQPVPPDWLANYFFALTPLVLAGVGLWVAPRAARMWAVFALIMLLLSLGPTLLWHGQDTGLPLPYALLRALPFLEVFRGPARLNAVTTVLLALVAAVGLARLLPQMAPLPRVLTPLLLIGLLVAEGVRLPFPLRPAEVSPAYAYLAAQPGTWSVLELPFARPDRALRDMYTQVHHGQNTLDGHLSREVPHLPPESLPPFAAIEAARQDAPPAPALVRRSPAEHTQLLRALRLRYLVLHASSDPARTHAQAEQAQVQLGPLTQVYSDTALRLYRLDTVADWLDAHPGERTAMPLLLTRDPAWPPPEPTAYGPGRWLPAEGASLWAYSAQPQRVRLTLQLASLPGARPLAVTLNGQPLPLVSVAAGLVPRTYHMLLDLPAGPSHLTLHAPAGGVSPRALGLGDDERRLSFVIYQAQLIELSAGISSP